MDRLAIQPGPEVAASYPAKETASSVALGRLAVPVAWVQTLASLARQAASRVPQAASPGELAQAAFLAASILGGAARREEAVASPAASTPVAADRPAAEEEVPSRRPTGPPR